MTVRVILTVLLVGASARADGLVRVPGKARIAGTECFSRFEGTLPNAPPDRPRRIRCVDGDPACDVDQRPGQCAVRVSVRLNVTGPDAAPCSPADLTAYRVRNYEPDTHPRHDFDFAALDAEVSGILPLDAVDEDVPSRGVSIGLPLAVVPTEGSARWRRRWKRLRTRVDATGGRFDVDTRKIVCVPNGASSPCDGIAGTFDQIQKHVFSRRCAVPTCHTTATEEHQLVLREGDAFSSLVGVPPANPQARATGKLRVEPGDPANSFLMDKLHGDLEPGEGERMPFGLRRIHRGFAELIQDWIAAGAPEQGFVSPLGCAPGLPGTNVAEPDPR